MDFEVDTDEQEERAKKRRKKKQKADLMLYLSIFFFVLAIILIIVYAAGSKKTTPVPIDDTPVTPVVPVDPTPSDSTEPEVVKIVDLNSTERPLAVMIDTNIGDAKHAGLQDSYVNYEIIVEGGLTRIMALFKDKEVGIVGPVRSARNYFLDYALEHDAIYAHFGWSPNAEADIKELQVNNINGMVDTDAYMRDRNLPSPHNVFTSTKKLKSMASKKNYASFSSNWEVFTYSIYDINLGDQEGSYISSDVVPASKVTIPYSGSEYRSYNYDSTNKYYLRSKNGQAHIDRKSGNQLHYKNIIIMKVENRTIDAEGRQSLKTTGSGEGYYITNGNASPIRWSKESRSAKTRYTYKDGSEVILNDGNTFVQIVPTSSSITIE